MLKSFVLNNDLWHIYHVPYDDPLLIDRTGHRTVGTTDSNSLSVYLSSDLEGECLYKVLLHELCHCAIHSFSLIDQIHSVVDPKNWILAEEWLCNFIYDYGITILEKTFRILGERALDYLPQQIERFVA